MDNIKEAFQKVKQDIEILKEESSSLREGLKETREKIIEMCDILNKFNKKLLLIEQDSFSTQESLLSTNSTNPSTDPQEIKGLKAKNIGISTGNKGVPTDKQTNRQTDNFASFTPKISSPNYLDPLEILNSLDSLKKELRLKFKRLTEQEILVFSTIYQLEEERGSADYKSISSKINLSESSVRDYVQRIIRKGISINKKRINNKIIHLSIDSSLKKIASLSTILTLRDL